jgi:hypothetical protein
MARIGLFPRCRSLLLYRRTHLRVEPRGCYNLRVRPSVSHSPLLVIAFISSSFGQSGPFRQGDVLSAWAAGTLDIHQIVTGRGNAAFMMFPDGTTLLLDAGDVGDTEYADQRPASSRTTAQWITRYVRHMAGPDARIDYAVITHFHGDHVGARGAGRLRSRTYCRSGRARRRSILGACAG